MFGTIVEVRRSDRFAFIRSKDGEKFYANFRNFLDRPYQHSCHLVQNLDVEFQIARSSGGARSGYHDLAVNVTLIDPVPEFPTSQIEAEIVVWNTGTHGFAKNLDCFCQHIFVDRRNFLTDEQYLTPENLHTGSRIAADLVDAPGRPNCMATNIELYMET